MDFGSFVFTPDAVAVLVAGFLAAGATLGVLVAVLASIIAAAAQ